jgi:hypothetical protein
MNKHDFLKTTGISLALLCAVGSCSAPQEVLEIPQQIPDIMPEGEETANRPNIVWLFSDDHAYRVARTRVR